MKQKELYIVELLEYTESGMDYVEYNYDFDNRKDAMDFARKKRSYCKAIWYYKAGQTSDPQDLIRAI